MRSLNIKYIKYLKISKKFIFLRFKYKLLYQIFYNNNNLKGLLNIIYIYNMNIYNVGFSRIKYRCFLTNYNRIYRKFFVSRIVLRELVSKGNILGVRKSS